MKLAFAAATLLAIALGAASAHAQQVTTLIQFTNVWKYDQSGLELGTAWRTNDYDDSAWPLGSGLLGLEPDTPSVYNVHAPINTPLTISSTVTTFYFRTTFNFASTTNGLSLIASNLVDDGCVIYLNGVRAGGVRAPATYNANTFFQGATEGQLDVVALTNLDALRSGSNLLTVEVHQAGSPSSDIMWGMKLLAIQQTPLTITNQPQSQTVTVGDAVTLSVGVSGGPAIYRWQKDGVTQPSTSNTLRIANAQLANAGNYRVIITNSISAVTSSVATLTVFADTTGPRPIAAFVGEIFVPSGATWGPNAITVAFSENLNGSTVGNADNYHLILAGTTNTVPIVNILFASLNNGPVRVVLQVDSTDPDWIQAHDYLLTINNVRDTSGNIIAPDSQVAVSWPYSTDLVSASASWDFHNSAIFEPEVFDDDWFAPDFAPSFWWAQGQGIFYGGILANNPCPPVGTLTTQTGYQPEPALYRTTFQWPAHWPSNGILRIATAYDDGFVLYLDGKEIYRNNAGAAGSLVGLATKAASTLSVCTNLTIAATNLQPGVHCLSAAVLQANTPGEADSVFALRMDGLAYLSPSFPAEPTPALNLTPLGANSARLSWTGFGYALESSTNLSLGAASYPAGPWQQVTNMSNPYTVRMDELQRFFRLKK